MKLCKNCNYFFKATSPLGLESPPLCGHPAVQSPVDGSPRFTCSQLRNTSIHAVSDAGCDGEDINNPYGGGRTKVGD